MALEFLCSVNIENKREIAVHPEATHLRTRKGKLFFYRANPNPKKRMKPIPPGTNTITIHNYTLHKHWTDYGTATFISHQGNILNTYKLST